MKNGPGRKTDVADALWLAELLAHGLIRAPPERLRAAFQGRVTERHRFLLRRPLCQVDALAATLAEIDAAVDRDLDPFRQAVRLLRTIPGVSDLTAQVIVSEIGSDMNRFPTAGHLLSWAELAKVPSASADGTPAEGASHKRDSYLRAQLQRLRHRRGPKKAICAVAASILTAASHMLRDGTPCQDLGADHFHRASPEDQANRLARQITKLGFTCTLTPATTEPVSV